MKMTVGPKKNAGYVKTSSYSYLNQINMQLTLKTISFSIKYFIFIICLLLASRPLSLRGILRY